MLQLGDRAYKTHKALTDSHILKEKKSHTDGFPLCPHHFFRFFDLSYNPSLPSTSLGPQMCAGESLAKMELLLFFMSLLQKFTFQPPPGVPIWTWTYPGILVSSSNQCLTRYVLCPEPRVCMPATIPVLCVILWSFALTALFCILIAVYSAKSFSIASAGSHIIPEASSVKSDWVPLLISVAKTSLLPFSKTVHINTTFEKQNLYLVP